MVGERLEHHQVRRLRLVPAGEQAVDRRHRRVGGDHDVGPAATGVHDAAVVGDGGQRADDGGAGGDHVSAILARRARSRWRWRAAPGSARGTDAPRPRATTRRCAARAARCRSPRPTRSVTSSVVNGRLALGISALPGSRRTRSGRPRSATRVARAGSGSAGRARRGSRGARRRRRRTRSPPTGAASRRTGEQLDAPASEQVDARPDASTTQRHGGARRAGGAPRPERTTGQLAREVHDDGLAVGQAAVERGGTVAEVFTTTRSPAWRNSPSSSKRASTGAASPSLTSRRTWSRRPPDASGGSCASCAGSSTKSSDGTDEVCGLDHGYLVPAGTKASAW